MAETSREMVDCCDDNRYELIEKYKNKLIESTNIDSSEDEMKVIDNIFFRLWQMDWLDKLEKIEQIKKIIDDMLVKGKSKEYHNEEYKVMLLQLKTLGEIEQIVKGE